MDSDKQQHASYMREWTRRNGERINSNRRARREVTRDRINEQKRTAYRKQHPEQGNLRCSNCQIPVYRGKNTGRIPLFCGECKKVRTRQAARRFQQNHHEDEILRRKRYREEHREQLLQSGKAYRERTKSTPRQKPTEEERRELQNSWRAEYYERNREVINARKREYNKRVRADPVHHAHVLELAKQSRERRAASIAAAKKADHDRRWVTDPQYRAQCVTNTRNRRAKKRGNGGKHTAADIEELYRKQKGKCANCRVALRKKYHVDHVMPICLGGSNGPENLQLLCAPCNQRKSGKDPAEWAQQNGKLFC